MSLLAHGWSAYARRIEHDVALARYLYDRVVAHPELEPAGAPELSIVCFRFAPTRVPRGRRRRGYFNRLNKGLVPRLQLDGRTYVSNAVVNGRFCLRACIANFRTEASDLDRLLEVVVEINMMTL